MFPLLRPTALRRLLPPHAGALANARDSVGADLHQADRRHDLALAQARTLGTDSWSPLAAPTRARPVGHAVHLSSGDADLLSRLAAFVSEGLADGDVCVVVATAPHVAGLRRHLSLAGLPDDGLVVHDAAILLSRLLREGRPDADLFAEHVGAPLRAILDGGRQVRAFGEMVGLLATAGDRAGALELEQLWDVLQHELGFPLLCAYPPTDDARFVAQVHAGHSHRIITLG